MIASLTQNKLNTTLAAEVAAISVLAGVGLVGSGAASAATLTYSFTKPEQTTDIKQTGSLNKFNTSLGTLTEVKLTLSGAATQSYGGTNTSSNNQNARITTNTDFYFIFDNGIILTTPNNASPAFIFSNTSGVLSYAPGQTRQFGPFRPSTSVDYLFPTNSALSNFLGTAGSEFSVTCETLSGLIVQGGGGNITASQSTTAGCGASVTYTYNPAPPPQNVPEPSAVLGLVLLGLGAFFKRNNNQDSDKA